MCNEAIQSKNNENTETSGLSPVDPFRSLLVHFGMLLGVDDFETIDSYHRGKMWLHSAWLHRSGAVWGLGASLSTEKDEIRVTPGLAIDGLGRELYLDRPACLNLGQWYEEHKDDPEVEEAATIMEDGSVVFDAHVVARFRGCLARQVPALTEPCDGSGAVTAYSRVIETAELLLKPGKAPDWRTPPGSLPYHRLRLLFGLEDAIKDEDDNVVDSDRQVLDALDEIRALPIDERAAACLEAFRRFSALDEMELAPAAAEGGGAYYLFPERHDQALVPLADIREITLIPLENGWDASDGEVDNTIRPVLVPTATIQELLCGDCGCGLSIPEDAGGPRIDPDTVHMSDGRIAFKIAHSDLMAASVKAQGVSVTSFDDVEGWKEEEIESVDYDGDEKTVTVTLAAEPRKLVRLIVKGTGKFPFLGTGSIPLAGATGGPPGGETDGNDFVHTILRS